MDHLYVRTSGGTFGFVGALNFDRMRPTLLAVNGSFPAKLFLHDLVPAFPGANVLIAYLPAMGPPWSPTTVPSLTRGLAEAVQRLVGDSPLVVYGVSTGNLLSLGLHLPTIVRKLCCEPFLTNEGLWPFLQWARTHIALNPDAKDQHAYLEELFGILPDGRMQNKDYRYLVDAITVPTDVLVGAEPLFPLRSTPAWPSLTSDEDRALLRANKLVTLHLGPTGSGHAVADAGAGKVMMYGLIRQALLDASRLCN